MPSGNQGFQDGQTVKQRFQNIIFDKKKFTTQQARAWMKQRGYTPIKIVDVTLNYYRYRLIPPEDRFKYSYWHLAPGVTSDVILNY
jgi:hypothetical protein